MADIQGIKERLLLKNRGERDAKAQEKGDLRERIVFDVLTKMHERKEIFAFIKTAKFEYSDLISGIDFYVVIIRKKRLVVPLQVTGLFFAQEHKERHPHIDVVTVSEDDPNVYAEVHKRICEILSNF